MIIEICILISLIIATFSCILGISLASPDWYFHAIAEINYNSRKWIMIECLCIQIVQALNLGWGSFTR